MRHAFCGSRDVVLAAMLSFATGGICLADFDEYTRAESLSLDINVVCTAAGALKAVPTCKDGSLDRAVKAALAKARPATAPLLKRDQFRFLDTHGINADSSGAEDKDALDKIGKDLQQRIAVLDEIAQGFGRATVDGRWINAFGLAAVTPAKDGAYRVALSIGADDQACKVTALVQPKDGWLAGTPDASSGAKPDLDAKLSVVKIRLQGETLRVVLEESDALDCADAYQMTGSYFAAGKTDGSDGRTSAPFAAPSFDCARPSTSDEEEICADPDLAMNDVRLNRAWKQVQPRLDAATRKLLTNDQRAYVRSQVEQYPEFLHPAWDKQNSEAYHAGQAREKLDKLQRERIAVLEGFDEKRHGFEGLWFASNAVLTVTREPDGTLKASGWRWFQGDWKAGCDYEISGKASGDTFRSTDTGKNPDTLERDHATLIVNRADDVWSKRRSADDGDEAKCKRNRSISSTARLFPVRPSSDIDSGDGIR